MATPPPLWFNGRSVATPPPLWFDGRSVATPPPLWFNGRSSLIGGWKCSKSV